MSRTGWKRIERSAAALMGGKRYHANTGARLDFEGPQWVGQVKSVKTMSLAQMEALALEAERVGAQKSPPKLGALVVKRSAGYGQATPHLIVVTEAVWREMNGRIPTEESESPR